MIKYVQYEEKNLKYIKSKEEKIQNALCVYRTSDITSSINKLQLGALRFFECALKTFLVLLLFRVAHAIVFQKVIFGC